MNIVKHADLPIKERLEERKKVRCIVPGADAAVGPHLPPVERSQSNVGNVFMSLNFDLAALAD
jgi:hypothetical protein